MNAIELLKLAEAVLLESKNYPLLLKRRALKECRSLRLLATGSLKAERGVITLRKSA